MKSRLLKIGRKHFAFLSSVLFFSLIFFYFSIPALGDESATELAISPSTQTVNAGDSFSISIYCTPGSPVKGFELELSFDPSLVSANEIVEGDFFSGYNTFFNPGTIDNSLGKIINVFDLIVGPGNVSSSGSFITISFTAKTISGTSDLSFSSVGEWTGVTDEDGYLPINVSDGSVTVIGEPEDPPPSEPPAEPPSAPPIPPIDDNETENNPPVVLGSPSGPAFAEVGVGYDFEISAYDPDEDDIKIKFDWGDGSFSDWSSFVASNSSVSFSHSFGSVSNFLVRALAQDESGLESSWSSSLTVVVSSTQNSDDSNDSNESSDPKVDVVIEEDQSENQTIIFNATDSFNESIDIITYIWDFGDNESGTGKSPTHNYRQPGVYNVTLTMIDSEGKIYTKTMIITVTESDIQGIKQDGSSDKKANNFLFFGFLIFIFIILSIVFVFIYNKRVRKPIESYKKSSLSDVFAERSIERIDKRIERINAKLDSMDKPGDRKDMKSGPSDDYRARDFRVFEDESDLERKDLESLFKSKTDDFITGDKIDKLLDESLKAANISLDRSELIDINLLVDRILDRSIEDLLLNKDNKKDFLNDDISEDNLEKIVDDILRSRYK